MLRFEINYFRLQLSSAYPNEMWAVSVQTLPTLEAFAANSEMVNSVREIFNYFPHSSPAIFFLMLSGFLLTSVSCPSICSSEVVLDLDIKRVLEIRSSMQIGKAYESVQWMLYIL